MLKSLVAAAVAMTCVALGAAPARASDPFKLLKGPTLTTQSPAFIALDPQTRTLYVGSGVAPTLSVYDARTCSPQRPSGCGAAIATVRVGNTPVSLAIDRRTRTAYVTNLGDATLSIFDPTTCNATNVTGCRRPTGLVRLSGEVLGLAIDEPSDSVYVGSGDGVWLLDGTTCNTAMTSGCSRVSQVAVTGPNPVFPIIDPATRTLYVANQSGGTTVSLISTRTCTARVRVDCAVTDLRTGNSPSAVTIDPATHTLYVTNEGDGTVTVADRDRCNAAVRSGCPRPAPTTRVGFKPGNMVLDPDTHTLHVANGGDDTLSAVDITHCRAGDTGGCDRRWPARQLGDPDRLQLDRVTGTLLISEFLGNAVRVIDPRTCSAVRTTSCRREAPTFATGAVARMAIDPDVHTLFLTEPDDHRLALVDTAACAAEPRHCTTVDAAVGNLSIPVAIAIDRRTETIYLTDLDSHTVVLLDARHCKVSEPSSCVPIGPAIGTGEVPNAIAVNEATHAVYVVDAATETLSTFDGTHCNARDRTGCPAAMSAGGAVGSGPQAIAVDPATGTVYVANFGGEGDTVGIVSVVDAARCCATVATITVGANPFRVALDPILRTLYVPNQAFDDQPGSVSVVDTRTCNAQNTSGCGRTPPRVASGRGSFGVTVDALRHRVYTADYGNATVSRIDATTCNAFRTDGCDRPPLFAAIGSVPIDVIFDPTTRTLYADNEADSTVSVIDAR